MTVVPCTLHKRPELKTSEKIIDISCYIQINYYFKSVYESPKKEVIARITIFYILGSGLNLG